MFLFQAAGHTTRVSTHAAVESCTLGVDSRVVELIRTAHVTAHAAVECCTLGVDSRVVERRPTTIVPIDAATDDSSSGILADKLDSTQHTYTTACIVIVLHHQCSDI